MNAIWDKVLVGIAVLLATLYAGHALAPKAWRNAVYARLGIRVKGSAGGCSSCESCEGTASTTPKSEVAVPISRIRRRR
jgi:hypothetical protein